MEQTAVIFDMDGVLVDSERLMLKSFEQAMAEKGFPSGLEAYLMTLGSDIDDTLAVFSERCGGPENGEALLNRMVELTRDSMVNNGVPVREGAPELLAFLQEKGCRLALASSNQLVNIEAQLNGAGLLHYFETVVSGDDVSRGKPDPEIYAKAFARLNIPSARAFAIEDAPAGVRSASGAGLLPILVPDLQQPDAGTVALAHRVFDTLWQVRDYFASIL